VIILIKTILDMRKFFTVLAFLVFSSSFAQTTYNYNFGTGTGTYSTASGSSTTFLPAPADGLQYVRMGSGAGSFVLEASTIGAGGSQLRIVAPTGGSVNKFALHTISSPTTSFTMRFKLRMTGGSSGTFYCFIGNGSPFTTVGTTFSGATTFAGLRFAFGAGTAITTNTRQAAAWVTTGLSATAFVKDQTYTVDIYCNNSASTINYTYGSARTIGSGTADVYINGALAGDDLDKAQLPDLTTIDDVMFYGESSTGNTAQLILDDIYYRAEIASTPLPVELSSFTSSVSGNSVSLNWSTVSELNNSGFDIERKSINSEWNKIGSVEGKGTSNAANSYSFYDKSLLTGKYNYRLKQIDYNGNYEYFELANEVVIGTPEKYSLGQNYPNPFNPSTTINFELPLSNFVSLKVYDMMGREAASLVNENKEAGFYSVKFDGSKLSSGMYFYKLQSGDFSSTKKFILVK